MKTMKNFFRMLALFLSVLLLSSAMCACDSDKENSVNSESEELLSQLVGEWGRLDEVMHYFYEDKTCIIGGMQGTYDIDGNKGLVLTTMDGSETTYEWALSGSEAETNNYWNLDGDTITINGNTFSRIVDEETPTDAS